MASSSDTPTGGDRSFEIGLGSSAISKRLNLVDKIRSYGIADSIELPQLAVCGDQSSGKSSVLEGLTGVPFPRQDGLCTRFATEIIIRHAKHAIKITATIQPHGAASTDASKRMRDFRVDLKDLNELPGVISAAAEAFGLNAQGEGSKFSRHVLRLEIVGDTGLHLTVVDLPGLIPGAEKEEDSRLVDQLVVSYMKSARTIMLVVLPAGNDIETNTIISKAQAFDKEGNRTIGVVTKPDLINAQTEGRIAALTHNLHRKLKLGYFLLRNPSPSQLSSGMSWQQRVQMERDFFSSPEWTMHRPDFSRIGIERLRKFCQDKLAKHIEHELPRVSHDMVNLVHDSLEELRMMGEERSDITQIRVFLTNVYMQLRHLTQSACDGEYSGDRRPFFDLEPNCVRLRAEIRKMNMAFSDRMRLKGAKRTIDQISGGAEDGEEQSIPSSKIEVRQDSGPSPSNHRSGQLRVTEHDFMDWIRKVVSRVEQKSIETLTGEQTLEKRMGRELPGTSNHNAFADLFHEQSSLWEEIATNHINNVTSTVLGFFEALFNYAIRDNSVRTYVSDSCQKRFSGTVIEAESELEKLIEDDKRQPSSFNHYFTDNVQKSRSQEKESEARKSAGPRITVDMDEQACIELRHNLTSYYKVARKQFVDNVCRQVIERHIMADLERMFNPTEVVKMSDEEVRAVGGETAEVGKRRSELQSLVKNLRLSLDEMGKRVL